MSWTSWCRTRWFFMSCDIEWRIEQWIKCWKNSLLTARRWWKFIRRFKKRMAWLDAHILEWKEYSQSETVNPAAIETAVRDYYRIHGITQPKAVILCSNPAISSLCIDLMDSPILRRELLGDVRSNLNLTWIHRAVNFTIHDVIGFHSVQVSGFIQRRIFNTINRLIAKSRQKLIPDNNLGRSNTLWDVEMFTDVQMRSRILGTEKCVEQVKEMLTNIFEALGIPRATLSSMPYTRIREWPAYWSHLLDKTSPIVSFPDALWFDDLVDYACLIYLAKELFSDREPLQITQKELKMKAQMYANGVVGFHPYLEVAFVCVKPRLFHRDAGNQPHNDNGPAVIFHDGQELYYHHGVVVPPDVIRSPASLRSADILKEPNAEIRRVMIAKKGLQAFLAELDTILLDADYEKNNPNPRKLYKIDLPDDEPIVALHVIDPAKKRLGLHADVFLRVPPGTETCVSAAAWTFGFVDQKEYCPCREE